MTMTKEDRLYSMRMVELAAEAEKLGIKIDKKGSKAKAVEKILAVLAEEETAQTEEAADVTEEATEAIVPAQTEEATEETAQAEEAPQKKRTGRRSKKSFEELVADISSPGNVTFVRNRKNEVIVKRGKRQIFRYTGRRLVCIREALVEGLKYTTHSYGYVVAPSCDNMNKIFINFAK